MVNKWIELALSGVYAPVCVLCGTAGQSGLDLCLGCRADLPRIARPCPRCGLPLPDTSNPGTPCGTCQQIGPQYDRCWAPFAYSGPIPYLITGLKFRSRLAFARLLGELLVDALRHSRVRYPELLLPVPLHRSRLRERGYNQALEVGRHIAKRIQIPLAARACIRTRHTAPQVGLDRTLRHRNMRGAFALTERLPVRHVALIDDVVSTGSTVEEVARTLKAAGIARVDVWAVARATLDRF